jgi:hypothetical protein
LWVYLDFGRTWLWPPLWYCSGIHQEILRNTRETSVRVFWLCFELTTPEYYCSVSPLCRQAQCVEIVITTLLIYAVYVLLLLQNWMLSGQKCLPISPHLIILLLLKLSGGSKVLGIWIRPMSKQTYLRIMPIQKIFGSTSRAPDLILLHSNVQAVGRYIAGSSPWCHIIGMSVERNLSSCVHSARISANKKETWKVMSESGILRVWMRFLNKNEQYLWP